MAAALILKALPAGRLALRGRARSPEELWDISKSLDTLASLDPDF
jgi:hypothetical protein